MRCLRPGCTQYAVVEREIEGRYVVCVSGHRVSVEQDVLDIPARISALEPKSRRKPTVNGMRI